MEIIFQAHNAVISERMKERAERAIRGAARRIGEAGTATVRFEGDGPVRRVEVVLHAPGSRHLVAEGYGRYYGPALAHAVAKLKNQAEGLKAPQRARRRAALRSVARS